MKKIAGLVLVMVGVGLAALYGARNPDVIVERAEAGSRAAILGVQEQGAWTAVCGLDPDLEAEDACAAARPALPGAIKAAEGIDAQVLRTRAWVRAQRAALAEDDVRAAYVRFLDTIPAARAADAIVNDPEGGKPSPQTIAAIDARREAWAAVCAAADEDIEQCAAVVPENALGAAGAGEDGKPTAPRFDWAGITPEQAPIFDSWFGAAGALQEARLEAASVAAPPPGARLSAWFSVAGLPFVIGIVLIVAGGVLARIGEREAAESEGGASEDDSKKGPRDLGVVLDTLSQRASELATDIGDATKLPEAQVDSIKNELDILVAEQLEPVIESRGRVQARYGMGGFAAIFGPLSAGERKLNRAWSALVDGHPPEARDSLVSASAHFEQARAELDGQAKAA